MRCPKCYLRENIDNYGQGYKCTKCGTTGSHKEFEYLEYIAILECSAGNLEVGSMWYETKICNKNTTIKELLAWKSEISASHGRLIITTKPVK